jgi:hypothetical protein
LCLLLLIRTSFGQPSPSPGVFGSGKSLAHAAADEVSSGAFALHFDGVDDYVDVPDSAVLDVTQTLTLEAWIRFETGGTDNPRIISKGWEIMDGWELSMWGTGQNRKFELSIGPTLLDLFSNTELSANTWYHVAASYDGMVAKLYINGNEDSSASVSGSVMTNNSNLNIGHNSGNNSDKYQGLIDEVRVWNVARTGNEIRQEMLRELSGTEPGLVGYWRFNEGSGQLASDSSDRGNDGRLGNSAQTDNADPLWVTSDAPIGINLTFAVADFSPAAPIQAKPGDPAIFSAFVENIGGEPSGPFWLEVWGSRTGGLTREHFLCDSEVISSIAAGGAHSYSGVKPLYSIPDGPYTVVFAADRPNQVPEWNERDNRYVVAGKRLLVLRPPTNADLAIEGFTFAPTSIHNAEAITLGGQVRNIGTDNSGPFWIEFWGSFDRSYAALSFFLCDSIYVPNLAPGAVIRLSDYAKSLYNCPTGVFMAGVFVDRNDQVNERNETNNYSFVDGIVFNASSVATNKGQMPHLAAGPDLVVVSADFSPVAPTQAIPGQTITLVACVENRGSTASGPFWVEFWGSRMGGLSLDQFVADSESVGPISWGIPAGGVANLVLTRSLYSIPDGPYTIVVVADRPQQIAESDEGNNRLAVAGKRLLTIRPATQVNLTIEGFTLTPNQIHYGQELTLDGTVRNTGTQDSGPFWIEFWGSQDQDYPNLGFFLCDSILTPNLAPGMPLDLRTQRVLYQGLPTGNCAVLCFVDRSDLVNETNEADNYAVLKGYQVGP